MINCPYCSGPNNENARFCRHCGSPLYETEYSSTKLPLGTILDDQYKIIDYVAKGGMGAVYKAVDLKISKVWAVKEMLDYFDTEAEREYAVQRFATEAQILYDLDHESIPKFADCFVSENRYYLIMEFIDGKDLSSILEEALEDRKPGMDEKFVIELAIQTCKVLEYLHSQKPPIIYRDLKPGNIMVTEDNKICLIDFGIARLFDPRTKGTMVGTQGYAPPEQYKGKAEPRSDMYSLAACMHHLLTGKDPRNDIPFNFPLVRHIRKDLSEKIEKILEKALLMKVDKRFKDMKEMQEALCSPVYPFSPSKKELVKPGLIQPDTEDLSKLIDEFSDDVFLIPDLEDEEQYDTDHLTDKELKELELRQRPSFWYMFRSDRRHSGKSPYGKNIKGKLVWSFNAGSPIRSSPALGGDGTIYFGANNGNIYAVTPEGQTKWVYPTKGRILSSPSLNKKGEILVGSNDCYLYALSLNGKFKWKFRTYGRLRSSPCVSSDGTIYIGSYDHYFYALNPDGTLKWRIDLEGYVESAPALTVKGDIYIACKGAFNGGSFIYCLKKNGEINWYSKIKTSIRSSPCVSNTGIVYIGGMDGILYSFNPNGTIRWKFQSKGPIISSPVYDDGSAILFGSFDRNVYSVDPDGALLWKYNTYSSVASSPAISGNNTIFIGGDDYFIYSLSFDGQVNWKVKCGDRVRSSPAIGNKDTLYVGSDDGFLYAIE